MNGGHLAGDGLELVHRRLLIITLVAGRPLLLMSALSSSTVSLGKLSFLHDVEVHVRFLIALPVLVAAELLVHSRIRPVVRAFVERRIVLPEDLPRFHSAIESAVRLRNSVRVEIGILLFVYTFGPWLWHRSDRSQRSDLVCHARRALAFDRRRHLVRVRQHPHLAVHPSALVREVFHLVSLSVAGLQNRPQPGCDSSGSLCRSCFFGQKRLRLRPDSFRAGHHACRSGCESGPLQRRELIVVQGTDHRLCCLLRASYFRPTVDVHTPLGSCNEERAWPTMVSSLNATSRASNKSGSSPSEAPSEGTPRIRRYPVSRQERTFGRQWS